MALTPKQVVERVEYMRARDAERNAAQEDVLAVREGRWNDVSCAIGKFPEDWPKPIVSNMIDIAAKDFSENLGPLPTFESRPTNMASDAAKRFADKLTKIINGHVEASNLQAQMYGAADRLITYGFTAFIVEPDFEEKTPKIRADDNFRAHYQLDRWGRRTLYYCRVFCRNLDELAREFPEAAGQLYALRPYGDNRDHEVEVAYWYDDDQQMLVTLEDAIVLYRVENPIGRCPVRVVEMPKLGKTVRGQFDDAIPVQVARAVTQNFILQATEEIVNAPLVAPLDVQEVPFGPGAVIRTENPNGVAKVQLAIPAGLFAELQNLALEQRLALRYPEGRSGNIDASIITGQGVEALMGTFSSVVQTAQLMLAAGLRDVMSMVLEMDEKLFGNVRKTVRGRLSGAPYEVTYTPARDIRGNYHCEVTYGLTAGLDPNRALVLILQSLGAGVISHDTAMRHLPVDINVEEEKRQIDIESVRMALTQAVAGYAQAIPMMATQGMDPAMPVLQIAEVMRLRQEGKSIEEAVREVFAPPPPEPSEEATAAGGAATESEIFNEQTGLPEGIAPGQAQFGQGGAADLLMALVGTTPSGAPNLALNVSRRIPAA